MTQQCGSDKLRALIEANYGDSELSEYDYTIDQCKIGKALKDDHVWAALCPEYPNLKGVTCQEIRSFITTAQEDLDLSKARRFYPAFFYTNAYLVPAKKLYDEYTYKYKMACNEYGTMDIELFDTNYGGQEVFDRYKKFIYHFLQTEGLRILIFHL